MNCKCKKCGASFKSKLALALYSFLSICCINLFAQNCNNKLSIQVVDLHDGTPLSNANIEINELEIPTGNPLLIEFDNNLKIKKYYYLDKSRAKNIIFNQSRNINCKIFRGTRY